MKNIIQFTVKKGQDGYYVASANNFAITTQARTFEILLKNVREATELYFEEAEKKSPIVQPPSIFVNYEMPISIYA